jgi:hypothetical protein
VKNGRFGTGILRGRKTANNIVDSIGPGQIHKRAYKNSLDFENHGQSNFFQFCLKASNKDEQWTNSKKSIAFEKGFPKLFHTSF